MNIMEGYNQAYFKFFTSENEHCDRLVKGILTDQVFTVWSRQKKLNGSSNSGARVQSEINLFKISSFWS